MSESQQPAGPRMRLADLPELAPPEDRLAAVLAQTRDKTANAEAGGRRWLTPLALAASVMLAVGLLTLQGMDQRAQADPLAPWMSYSEQLEAQLEILRPASRVLHGHRAVAITTLQQEVAQIDEALANPLPPAVQEQLWIARTAALNDLVAVHAAAATYPTPDAARDPVVTLQPPLAVSTARIEL
ncbi:MAG: hypothetical protein AAGA23_17355 [Pseudomonadota bacterium]